MDALKARLAPVALSALAAATIGAAPAVDGLSAVRAHLAAVDTMTADFVQTDRSGKSVGGTLTLKKPGKIRFQYQKGVPILIVADGKSLWFLDYQVGQKQRWPIANAPLGILLDPSRDATRFARVVPGDTRLISVEAADPRHPEYGKITLVFAPNAAAPGGLALEGWVALDAQNNRTRVVLSNQRFNIRIADNSFQFNDPQRNSLRR